MTFRDWLKHQITHHDNLAAKKRDGGYARGYHNGVADLAHRALAEYEKDENRKVAAVRQEWDDHFADVEHMLRKD